MLKHSSAKHRFSLMLAMVLLLSICPVEAHAPIASAPAVTYQWAATWGASNYAGIISQPQQIVADGNGNVYIADPGIHRIQIFTAGGAFVRSVGQAGAGSGQFNEPTGVAVRNSRVYVADWYNSRVQVFNADGSFVQQIGGWTSTIGPMQMPNRVGADAGGRVYVASEQASGISRYSAAGALEQTFQNVPCQIDFIVVASSGTFFCPHSYDNGIVRVAENGAQSIVGGASGQSGFIADPSYLAITPDDHLWAYDVTTAHVYHYNPDGSFAGSFAARTTVKGLAAGGGWVFALTDARRVQVYQSSGALTTIWGATADLRFDHPDGLAVAPDGSLYVLEKGRRRVQHVDGSGVTLTQMGAGLAAQGNLVAPVDVAVDGWGRLYVLDNSLDPRVMRFANDRFDTVFYGGNYVASNLDVTSLVATADWLVWSVDRGMRTQVDLDGYHNSDSPLSTTNKQVVDMAVSAADRLFSLNIYGAQHVDVTTLTGPSLAFWGPTGAQPGQLLRPTGIALDLRGRVFVTDTKTSPSPYQAATHRHSVEVFDEAGTYLTSFGGLGEGQGQFVDPQALAALPDGRIVVADTGNNRLQVFAPVGPLPAAVPLPSPTSYTANADRLATDWEDFGPTGVTYPRSFANPRDASPQSPLLAVYGDNRQLAASTDGVTWTRLPRRDMINQNRFTLMPLYAGSSALISEGPWYDAAYRSQDLGRSWTRLGDAPAYGPQALAASPGYDVDQTLFTAAYRSGVWRSVDSGATWELRSLAGTAVTDLAVVQGAGQARTLFVNGPTSPTTDGLLRSIDDGLTWSGTQQNVGVLGVSPVLAQDQDLFLGEFNGGNGGVLRSRDRGLTWQRVGATTLPAHIAWRQILLSPNYAHDRTLLAWFGAAAYLSIDAGESWRRITPETLTNLQAVAFAPTYSQDSRILLSVIGESPFVVTQNQGASWQPVTPGLPGASVYDVDLAQVAGGADWALIPEGLLARNGTQWTWVRRYSSPLSPSSMIARSPNFAQDRTAIVRDAFTTDGGATWQLLNQSYPSSVYSAGAFAPNWSINRTALVVLSDTSPGYAQVITTTNGGASWQSRNATNLWRVTDVAFDANWPASQRIYAAGAGGLRYTTDLGQSWHSVGEPVGSAKTMQVAMRQESGQYVLYAATSSLGVWRSTDRGATWSAVNTDLPNGHACALTANAEVLVAGLCDGRVYAQATSQGPWRELLIQPGGVVTTLAVRQSAGQLMLWVGTGSGLYRTALTFTTVTALPKVWLPLYLRRR